MISFAKPNGRSQEIFYHFPHGSGNGVFSEFGYGFEPEYITILEYGSSIGAILPSASNQIKQNALIRTLKLTGIWIQLDVFYNFYTDGDLNFAKINWISPGTNQAVTTNTFTPLTGFSGSGGQITTGYIPSAANNWTQNDASYFLAASLSGSSGNILNSANNAQLLWSSYFNGGTGFIQSNVNDTTAKNLSITEFFPLDKLWHHNRIASTTNRLYQDGILKATNAQASTGEYASAIGLAVNSNAIWRCLGFGAGLSGNELNLYNAWQTYKNI